MSALLLRRGQLRCQVCTHPVEGDRRFCPPCIKRRHLEQKRTWDYSRFPTCHDCGASFEGTVRARYCPRCAAARKVAAVKRTWATRAGEARTCVDCNASYTSRATHAKRCPQCRTRKSLSHKHFRSLSTTGTDSGDVTYSVLAYGEPTTYQRAS